MVIRMLLDISLVGKSNNGFPVRLNPDRVMNPSPAAQPTDTWYINTWRRRQVEILLLDGMTRKKLKPRQRSGRGFIYSCPLAHRGGHTGGRRRTQRRYTYTVTPTVPQ